MEKKQKRFYKVDEVVWVVSEKKEGKIIKLDKENLEVTVEYIDNHNEHVTFTGKLWEIDKLKYVAKDKFIKEKRQQKNQKITYFSSVKGGVIPTREIENAGRDCYARLEPQLIDGREVYELHIPQLTMAKIPLGFASYLNVEDLLSLKHERSSIGSTGMINVSGLIDSTYQGEVILQVVPLIADVVISSEVEEKFYDEATNTYFVPYKSAIAQAVVFKQSEAKDEHIPYDELLNKPSTRGTGGWGSTGK